MSEEFKENRQEAEASLFLALSSNRAPVITSTYWGRQDLSFEYYPVWRVLDEDARITDADSNLQQATIRITNATSVDQLNFDRAAADAAGIQYRVELIEGVLALYLTGTAIPSVYQQILSSVDYMRLDTNLQNIRHTVSVEVRDVHGASADMTYTVLEPIEYPPPVINAAPQSNVWSFSVGQGQSIDMFPVLDVESPDLRTATITVRGFRSGSDKIEWASTAANGFQITANYVNDPRDYGLGRYTVTIREAVGVQKTQEEWSALLRSMRYDADGNGSAGPVDQMREVWLDVGDAIGGQDSVFHRITVDVAGGANNQKASIGAVTERHYGIDRPVMVLDPNMTIADDGGYISSAIVQLTYPAPFEGDELRFLGTLPQGITMHYDPTWEVITFSGQASVEVYQNLFRNIAFVNSSQTWDQQRREISFVVHDGARWSDNRVIQLNFSQNRAPDAASPDDGQLFEWPADWAQSWTMFEDFTLTDSDSAIGGAVLRITNVNGLADQGRVYWDMDLATRYGITVSSNIDSNGALTMTLSGSATPDAYRALIASLFVNLNAEVTQTVQSRISLTVTDIHGASDNIGYDFRLTVPPPPPEITGIADITWTHQNGGQAVALFANAVVTGTDIARIEITLDDPRMLRWTEVAGLTVTTEPRDWGNYLVTITGQASTSAWQELLRSFTFDADALGNAGPMDRRDYLYVKVLDNYNRWDSANLNVTVDVPGGTNTQKPVIAQSTSQWNYSYGQGELLVDPNLTLREDSGYLTSARVSIGADWDNLGDRLMIRGVIPQGLTVAWDQEYNELRITGTAATWVYQDLLRRLVFVNNSTEDMDAGGLGARREIAIFVHDGVQASDGAYIGLRFPPNRPEGTMPRVTSSNEGRYLSVEDSTTTMINLFPNAQVSDDGPVRSVKIELSMLHLGQDLVFDDTILSRNNLNYRLTDTGRGGTVLEILNTSATPASNAAIAEFLRSVRLERAYGDSSYQLHTYVTVTVNDGMNNDSSQYSLAHRALPSPSQPPVITSPNEGGQFTARPGDANFQLFPGLSLSDDGGRLEDAQVLIANMGEVQGYDIVWDRNLARALGVQIEVNRPYSGAIEFNISGIASTADYARLLSSFAMTNIAGRTAASQHEVHLVVLDAHGNFDRSEYRLTIDQAVANRAPIIASPDENQSYTLQPGDQSFPLFVDLAITDPDSNQSITRAEVSINNLNTFIGYVIGINETLAEQLGLRAEFIEPTAQNPTLRFVITKMNGSTATAADFARLIETISFDVPNSHRTTSQHTVSLTVWDDQGANDLARYTFTMERGDRAPPRLFDHNSNWTAQYVEGQTAAFIASDLGVTEESTVLHSAEVMIVNRWRGDWIRIDIDEDFMRQWNIRHLDIQYFDGPEGISQGIRISGEASVQAYTALLQKLTYESAFDDPTRMMDYYEGRMGYGSMRPDREIALRVSDGSNWSNELRMRVDVHSVNDALQIGTAYRNTDRIVLADGERKALFPDVTLTDPDSPVVGGHIIIYDFDVRQSVHIDHFLARALGFDVTRSILETDNAISISFNLRDGRQPTQEQFQMLLRSVSISTPTNIDQPLNQRIRLWIDEVNYSDDWTPDNLLTTHFVDYNLRTQSAQFDPTVALRLNPLADASASLSNLTNTVSGIALFGARSWIDIEDRNGFITGATVRLSGAAAMDALNLQAQGLTVASQYDDATDTLTLMLSGRASVEAYEAALYSLRLVSVNGRDHVAQMRLNVSVTDGVAQDDAGNVLLDLVLGQAGLNQWLV